MHFIYKIGVGLMICRKCGCSNIQLINENTIKTKNRGCIGWLAWLTLAFFTFGLILIIPLLTNSKTKIKNKTKAVCMTCGNKWYI